MPKCHACNEEISDGAKICRHCMSSQSRLHFSLNKMVNPGTLAFSVISLCVSIFALYVSMRDPAPKAVVAVQVVDFQESEFSFFVANLGDLPTVIRDFDLVMSFVQGDETHVVEAAFAQPPVQLMPGQSNLIEMSHAQYLPRYTNWEAPDIIADDFSTEFLNLAAALGSNLHCEVRVHYPSQRYFPSNIETSTDAVNGVCAAAMAWYANEIGPLRVEEVPSEQ